MSSIKLVDVTFRYPHATCDQLSDFNLDVGPGSCTALLGPSGCAKTTVLRLIAGLERPAAGEIYVGDVCVASSKSFQAPESRGIGLVFQDYALFPHMTVQRNVEYGLRGMGRGERKQRVAETLEMVGMSELAGRYPHQLSGGQQQRVALARALAPRPKVLLLDEPFSNLDADLRQQVREEVRELLERAGVTSVLVTHDAADAQALATNVVHMQPAGTDNAPAYPAT